MSKPLVFTPQPLMAFRGEKSVGIFRLERDGSCGPEVAEIVLETIEVDDDQEAMDYAFAEAQHMAAATDLLEMLDNVTAIVETMLCTYGHMMYQPDRAQRTKLSTEARSLITRLRPVKAEQA